MAAEQAGDERRRFKRVSLPMYFRDVRRRVSKNPVLDVSMGGLRVYSDEPLQIGERFAIEVVLDSEMSINGVVRVAWIEELPEDEPARYDVGLEIVAAEPDQLKRLKTLIDEIGEG